MDDDKLNKHYIEYDMYLRRNKKVFENKLSKDFAEKGALKDFQLLKTLGCGSFGRVVLAKQKENKSFAIKMLEKKHIVRTKQIKHTVSEIRILDAIDFAFIISMEFFFKDNVYLFLVLPFISGGEMFVHLRKKKKFDESISKFYAAQVILAFEYMHYMGLVYRDLKPENILVDVNGYLKITDLGFCKKIDFQRTYTLCGTPEYLAPEIILSQGYNKSVDWWSLGILIYEMTAGYPPFYSKDPMKLYEKIVVGRYSFPEHFSKTLKNLISNILQVDRSKRYGILKNGSKDIKGHEWFKTIEWDQVLNKRIKPIFKPTVHDEGDTSNFDTYADEKFRSNSKDEFPDEFVSFKI